MREIWYSDNRDLVKWGVLVTLARANSLQTIVQVPYWRSERKRPHFSFKQKRAPIPDEVWTFFRDLKQIERLGDQCGSKIKVIRDQFTHTNRKRYSDSLIQQLKPCTRPLLLFLDPDTGLEPNHRKVTHTSEEEIRDAWAALHARDWLVFYQHARRDKGWVASASAQLSKLCDQAKVNVARSESVGKDVAFLCVEKRAA
jgi:hypothetical protein